MTYNAQQLNKSTLESDMAVTTNILTGLFTPFSGDTGEDVCNWLANIKFIIKLFALSEGNAKKAICINLRGDAFGWARRLLQKEPNTTGSALLHALEERFTSKLYLFNVANRFLSNHAPQSVNDYLTKKI
ncbi:hypothetical protein PAEPH01_1533 [Pancytospora epiphaga]|nr:hypothetical protein PAEPH01_1533 [Pancytospora epiphaga]